MNKKSIGIYVVAVLENNEGPNLIRVDKKDCLVVSDNTEVLAIDYYYYDLVDGAATFQKASNQLGER